MRRVIAGKLEGAPHETLLVVDATTGQNGLQQARLFGETVGVTGVALTKLDGSAKGGIAVAIAHELGLPVKLVGVGEGLDDLRPFDPPRLRARAGLGVGSGRPVEGRGKDEALEGVGRCGRARLVVGAGIAWANDPRLERRDPHLLQAQQLAGHRRARRDVQLERDCVRLQPGRGANRDQDAHRDARPRRGCDVHGVLQPGRDGHGRRLAARRPEPGRTADGRRSVPQSSSPEPSAGQTPVAWKVVGVENNDSRIARRDRVCGLRTGLVSQGSACPGAASSGQAESPSPVPFPGRVRHTFRQAPARPRRRPRTRRLDEESVSKAMREIRLRCSRRTSTSSDQGLRPPA